MPKLEPKLLKEKILQMPQKLRDAYFSENTTTKIMIVAKNYNLHIDQSGELSDEVSMVFLGMTPASDFVKRVEERLKIDHETAEKIVRELNSEIFEPVRGMMKRAEENRNTPSADELLKEIEHTTAAPAAPETPDVLAAKLAGPVSAPAPASPAPMPVVETPIKKVDPYLEPVDNP